MGVERNDICNSGCYNHCFFVGCVCIKKPAVRLGLEIIVVLGLMLAVLIGSVTYTIRYRVNFVDSYKAGEGISPSMTRIFSMLVCN